MSDELKKIIYSMHPLERKVLQQIKLRDIEKISQKTKLSIAEVNTAINMLEERKYVIVEKLDTNYIGLDKFGEKFVKGNLPEIKLLKEIIDKEKPLSKIKLDKEEISAALGILKKEKLIDIRNENEMILSVTDNAKAYLKKSYNPLVEFKDDVEEILLTESQKSIYDNFKQRKGFLKRFTKTKFEVIYTNKGEKVALEIEKKYKNLELVDVLETSMLKDGSWRDKDFRGYKTDIDVPIVDIGRRHPMTEANNIIRDIFVEMGFKEMQGPVIESEFWCFDALWIPQDHPARDDQDTFFLEGKAKVPQEYKNEVKLMHEEGIKRTHTAKGDFSDNITSRRILRTHSTATTFRTLYELSKAYKNGEDINGKYFYCAHNFRNEAIDATHLSEFFQAEGFIIGDNLSLADLMGFIQEYYAKLGITKIRFKPTFNPYTEPSMEAHYYDPKMDKWYALINSGIFRPETLKPLGIENKTIIAWGMGATRVAALLSKANNLRELTGTTCDLNWIKTKPIMKRKIVTKGGEN